MSEFSISIDKVNKVFFETFKIFSSDWQTYPIVKDYAVISGEL